MHKAIVITGAGKGLGKKLAEVFKAEGWTVIAPSREELDLSRQNSIDTFVSSLNDTAVDVLINCAGLYDNPASSVEDESVYNQLGDILNVYAVNSAAPKILADRLVPHLLKGTHKLVVSLSSGMGSHSQLDEYNAEHWVYSSSKAALNMAMHAFAVENPQIKSILFSPGWMNTSMGGKEAPIDPKIVAEKLFTLITKNIDSLMSGTCIQSEGKRLEW